MSDYDTNAAVLDAPRQWQRWGGNPSYRRMESPVGVLTLIADESALVSVLWDREKSGRDHSHGTILADGGDHPILEETERQLREYFAGKRTEFDLPLRPEGTDFQKRVWAGLRRIRFGELWSYGQLAEHIGRPGAARAVGAANGRNPIPIIVPCHRVIGSSGKLVGFGGGLEIKSVLIALEKGARKLTSSQGV